MPFPNEHAARQRAPGDFEPDSFRRVSENFPDGISAIMGKLKGETSMTVQSLRAAKDKWTVEKFRKWLGDHDFKTNIEPATGESKNAEHLTGEPLFSIPNVDIFASGVHNGTRFTEQDLDEMVKAASAAGFRIPIKQGHEEKSGAPALGWVENVRRVGKKLVADLVDLPKTVAEAIKRRSFDARSVEIFFNLKRGRNVFRRALKALALLGSEIPAVSDLTPLGELVKFDESEYDAVVYGDVLKEMKMAKPNDTEKRLAEREKQIEELKIKIGELEKQGKSSEDKPKTFKQSDEYKAMQQQIAELREQNRQNLITSKVSDCRVPAYRPYLQAFYDAATRVPEATLKFQQGDDEPKEMTFQQIADALVDHLNRDSTVILGERRSDGMIVPRPEAPAEEPANYGEASEQIHTLAVAWMAENKSDDYEAAVDAVLADPKNHAIKQVYAGVH